MITGRATGAGLMIWLNEHSAATDSQVNTGRISAGTGRSPAQPFRPLGVGR